MVVYEPKQRPIDCFVTHRIRTHPSAVCRVWDEHPGADGERSTPVPGLPGSALTMDSTDAVPSETRRGRAPKTELACLFDDPSDPSELTVFSPETPRMATEWLTVDRASAVRLDRMR